MKRKRISAIELSLLREQVEARYRADGGTELEWRSYLPRYEDLNARIQRGIKGRNEAAMSPNILRRLFWDTRNEASASFNVVYLNALAYYITDGALDHATWRCDHMPASPITHDPDAPTFGWNSAGNDPRYDPRSILVTPSEEPSGSGNGDSGMVAQAGSVHPVPATTTPGDGWHGSGTQKVSPDANFPHAQDPDPPPSQTWNALDMIRSLSFRAFGRPFMVAALFTGLFTFIFVLAFNEVSGYDNLERKDLHVLMTTIFGFTVFGPIGIGIALTGLSRWFGRTPSDRLFRQHFLLFLPVLFLVTFYVRQLFVRNGYLAKGNASPAFFAHPDFETLSSALSFILCIYLFISVFRHGAASDPYTRLWQATWITLSCGMVYFAFGAVHNILVTSGHINVNGFFIAPTIFSYKFPHPERLPLICFMIFTQVYLTFRLIDQWFGRSSAGTSRRPEQ